MLRQSLLNIMKSEVMRWKTKSWIQSCVKKGHSSTFFWSLLWSTADRNQGYSFNHGSQNGMREGHRPCFSTCFHLHLIAQAILQGKYGPDFQRPCCSGIYSSFICIFSGGLKRIRMLDLGSERERSVGCLTWAATNLSQRFNGWGEV